MGKEEELKLIADMLTIWQLRIHNRKALDFFDINRTAEDISMVLLNEIYGLKLENLNKDHPNISAIDLGDKKKKIAFQISSRKDVVRKITENLENFKEKHKKNYPGGIRFLFLNLEIPRLTKEQGEKFAALCPGFNAEKEVLGVRDLLQEINSIYDNDPGRFNKIKNILEREFRGILALIEEKPLFRELYQGSKARFQALTGPNGRFKHLDIQDILLSPSQLEKKDKKEKWLDAAVVIKGALKKESETDDNKEKEPDKVDETGVNLTNVLDALPKLWEEACCHTVLKGEGGMGKTVSLVRLWQEYTSPGDYVAGTPVPVFIQLNEINHWQKEVNGSRFIADQINRYYLNNPVSEKELLLLIKNPISDEGSVVPAVIMLLDGFNEITVEEKRRELLLELLDIMENCAGVQIVVTSRYDMRATMNWGHFYLLELVGLGKEQIDQYLGKWGLSPLSKSGEEGEHRLHRLLQNPMMLTIYAASCEVVNEYGVSSLYDFKQRAETPGELLWNFMEAQVVKYVQHSIQEERQKYFYKFLLKMLLPALGYEMEKVGQFQFTGDELDVIVEHYLKRFCQVDFLRTFREYRGHATAWSIDDCGSDDVFGKLEIVIKILSGEMSMLVKEGHSYRFLHQDFRDFFAAVHILNEVGMGLSQDEVAEVLTGGMISFYPRRYMGEIEGEHYCMPYLEEGKGWQIKSNESTLLARALKKCRGHFTAPYAYAMTNILESWKQLRGEWSGLDLTCLDLSKVLINGTVCSRFYKKTYLATCFDGSLISAKSLFHEGHTDRVTSAVYSPDGKKILSASFDKTIKEWDLESATCLRTYQGHEDIVTSAVYSADGQKILSASTDLTIKEWDVASGNCLRTYQGHTSRVTSAVYSTDGQKILSASRDQTIKEWDVASGNCLRTYQGHEHFVYNAVYSANDQKILSASHDKTIKEWDVASGNCLHTYHGHEHGVSNAVYSPDSQKILSASIDETIKEWDVVNGNCLQTCHGHTNSVTSAIYSADGQKILSASWDYTVKEWDVVSGTYLRTFQRRGDMVFSAYSADGQKILSASDDETIKEWDMASGTCLRTYQGHEDGVLRAVYSPDGQKIFSSSKDITIKEWDVASGTCLHTYQGHTSRGVIANYSTDGQKIFSTSGGHEVKIWDVETGSCLGTWDIEDEALHYNPFEVQRYCTFGKRLIEKDGNQIHIIDPKTNQVLHTLKIIPGLWIHGCSFKNLHPQSQLTDEGKQLLKMYGAVISESK